MHQRILRLLALELRLRFKCLVCLAAPQMGCHKRQISLNRVVIHVRRSFELGKSALDVSARHSRGPQAKTRLGVFRRSVDRALQKILRLVEITIGKQDLPDEP